MLNEMLEQCFSTFFNSRNLLQISYHLAEPKYSNIFSIFREPRKELAEPLGSAEPRLKNTVLERHYYKKYLKELWEVLMTSHVPTFRHKAYKLIMINKTKPLNIIYIAVI